MVCNREKLSCLHSRITNTAVSKLEFSTLSPFTTVIRDTRYAVYLYKLTLKKRKIVPPEADVINTFEFS